MVESDKGNTMKKIVLISIIVIIAIGFLIAIFVGFKGLKQFFMWLFGILLVIGILFGVAYIFYILFLRKSFVDIPATYKKKLIQTTRLMKNEMLGDLYLSGDTKHNRIKLGKYAYMRINLPKQITEVEETQTGDMLKPKEKKEKDLTQEVPVDCFILLKKGIFDYLFGDPVFILIKPEDHNYSAIFNDVTIYGFNLVPLDSQFFTIDKRNLDVDIIKGMTTNYIKEVVYEVFRDLDKLVKMSINLDQSHQKEKQKGMEFDIPSLPSSGDR